MYKLDTVNRTPLTTIDFLEIYGDNMELEKLSIESATLLTANEIFIDIIETIDNKLTSESGLYSYIQDRLETINLTPEYLGFSDTTLTFESAEETKSKGMFTKMWEWIKKMVAKVVAGFKKLGRLITGNKEIIDDASEELNSKIDNAEDEAIELSLDKVPGFKTYKNNSTLDGLKSYIKLHIENLKSTGEFYYNVNTELKKIDSNNVSNYIESIKKIYSARSNASGRVLDTVTGKFNVSLDDKSSSINKGISNVLGEYIIKTTDKESTIMVISNQEGKFKTNVLTLNSKDTESKKLKVKPSEMKPIISNLQGISSSNAMLSAQIDKTIKELETATYRGTKLVPKDDESKDFKSALYYMQSLALALISIVSTHGNFYFTLSMGTISSLNNALKK